MLMLIDRRLEGGDWLRVVAMTNACGSGQPPECVPVVVRGSQGAPETSLSAAPTPERESCLEMDGNESDFWNSQFLAECFLEQNLNEMSAPFPSMSQPG